MHRISSPEKSAISSSLCAGPAARTLTPLTHVPCCNVILSKQLTVQQLPTSVFDLGALGRFRRDGMRANRAIRFPMQGQLPAHTTHVPCKQRCDRKHACGHYCKQSCHEGRPCDPCRCATMSLWQGPCPNSVLCTFLPVAYAALAVAGPRMLAFVGPQVPHPDAADEASRVPCSQRS